MLSAKFVQIKKLRSTGNFPAARELIATTRPASDEDALEAIICFYSAAEFEALVKFSAQHKWGIQWPAKTARAIGGIVQRHDPRTSLTLAREAIREPGVNADAVAVFLILLQMNGLIDEAAAYVRERLMSPPADEVLLLTVLGEVAATIGDWMRAYSMATLVLSTNPHNTRALIICSMANFEFGNVHESLGNAIHADKVRPRDQTTILQLIKCYNKLADFYSTIAAFNELKDERSVLPEIHAHVGVAYARLDNISRAIEFHHKALASGRKPLTAIRGLLKIFINLGAVRERDALIAQYRDDIYADIEALAVLARDRLHRRELDVAHQLLQLGLKLSSEQGVGYDSLTWPVPEPRLRHDLEQLELLASRGKLPGSAARALTVLKRQHAQTSDVSAQFAPLGPDGEALRQALAEYHYCPDVAYSGTALGENDYSAIEETFMQSSPRLVIIDNFLSPAALACLREFCEEATIWKSYFDNGYVGALLGSGFSPRVLLAIADELKLMMPRVIGGAPLTQAWAFKYDQRLQGINMHADFANVNVNFWITPEDACEDKTTGGMVIYDVPAPADWTFEHYNGKSAKMAAFLAANNAQPQRVPYRENRCVLFDSTLFHTTDEIHFKPGYCNRRVNVTLLFGKSLNAD